MIEIMHVHHIGIRVSDVERSLRFYGRLGFEKVWENPDDAVVIVRNTHGIEINFIVNADDTHGGRNILMDVDPKYPGYTHVALQIASIEEATTFLQENNIPVSGGPERLGDGVSLFIRDPDRNVIELRQSGTTRTA
ncbi:MAG: VOC family protein [Acidiferrobacterales bacterium]